MNYKEVVSMLFSDVVVMAAPLFSFPFPVVVSMPVIVGVRLTVRLVLVHSGSFDEFLLLFVISIQFEKKTRQIHNGTHNISEKGSSFISRAFSYHIR